MPTLLIAGIVLTGLYTADPAEPQLQEAPGWADMVRVTNDAPEGVACRQAPEAQAAELGRVHFKRSMFKKSVSGDWIQVDAPFGLCWVPAKTLSPVHSSPVYCLAHPLQHGLEPITRLVATAVPAMEQGVAAGTFYPTFYQIALEMYYPLQKGEDAVALRDAQGKILARVSPTFKKALLLQGTASLKDGTVLNVGVEKGGERRYVALPKGHFGLGIKGYRIYPYRSVALDFDWLCDQLKTASCETGNIPKRDKAVTAKNREALVGTLLYIPRLAGADVGGTLHDGFVCAVDVGGGIKNDRIDLFVGTDPAGNPFYPACRRDNPFIVNGVESLIGADWYHWQRNAKGDYERTKPTEYRQNAPDKGLEVIAFPSIRCLKELAD